MTNTKQEVNIKTATSYIIGIGLLNVLGAAYFTYKNKNTSIIKNFVLNMKHKV